MQMNNKKRELIKNTLINNMSVLEDMLSGNSELKRKAIQLNIETLKLGWIHIALVGQTSCGKSTVINALSEDIVVPENPMTATPIPTYIARSVVDTDTQKVTVVPEDDKKKKKELTRKEFLTQFCYNVEDQGGDSPNRLRFREDRFAVVHTKGELFDKGAVLLDTLGSGATEFDNIKTSTILKGNVDVLIYIVGTNMLTASDIAFLQCYILGYSPKEAEIKKMNYSVGKPIITPDKLIILGNDKTGILRGGLVGYRTNKQMENGLKPINRKTSLSKLYFICNEKEGIIAKGLQNSICRIFRSKDCNQSTMQIENFAKEHILKCNFLVGRTLTSGIYPYSKYISFSPTKDEADFAADMERRQKRYLKFSEKDEEYVMWKETRKAVNRIINKKKNDIEQQRQNRFKQLLDEANRGNAASQVLVGLAYQKGRGVAQSYSNALLWYKKAAEQNDSNAMFYIALMYAYGADGEPNLKIAIHWLKKAVALDNIYAVNFLGKICEAWLL